MIMENLTLARCMCDAEDYTWLQCPVCRAVWIVDGPDQCPECLVPTFGPEENLPLFVEIGGEGGV